MMQDGLVTARTEGTPQGGPLSPLLSNILLTDLDRELERRQRRSACRRLQRVRAVRWRRAA
jgi:RNA-directed DNA polymerase